MNDLPIRSSPIGQNRAEVGLAKDLSWLSFRFIGCAGGCGFGVCCARIWLGSGRTRTIAKTVVVVTVFTVIWNTSCKKYYFFVGAREMPEFPARYFTVSVYPAGKFMQKNSHNPRVLCLKNTASPADKNTNEFLKRVLIGKKPK